MAYYTKFSILIGGAGFDAQTLAYTIEQESGHRFDVLPGPTLVGRHSWYSSTLTRDMKRVTERFPGLVFRIDGHGDEAGDVWRAYFKHGHDPVLMHARIVFDDEPEWATP